MSIAVCACLYVLKKHHCRRRHRRRSVKEEEEFDIVRTNIAGALAWQMSLSTVTTKTGRDRYILDRLKSS